MLKDYIWCKEAHRDVGSNLKEYKNWGWKKKKQKIEMCEKKNRKAIKKGFLGNQKTSIEMDIYREFFIKDPVLFLIHHKTASLEFFLK